MATQVSSDATPVAVSSASSIETAVAGIAYCGNGVTEPGEACDAGAGNSDIQPNACRTNCALPRCGDFVVDEQYGEYCDQGTANSDSQPDTCRTNCQPPLCGDGVRDSAEQCDDGNIIAGDGCSELCQQEQPTQVAVVAICGDGIVQTGEECDAGPENSNRAQADCRPDCTVNRCGNGTIDGLEQCDDGNRRVGDGCSEFCLQETVSSASVSSSVVAAASASVSSAPSVLYQSPGTQQILPAYVNLSYVQPYVTPLAQTGPITLFVMSGGAAAGISWVRRRR